MPIKPVVMLVKKNTAIDRIARVARLTASTRGSVAPLEEADAIGFEDSALLEILGRTFALTPASLFFEEDFLSELSLGLGIETETSFTGASPLAS